MKNKVVIKILLAIGLLLLFLTARQIGFLLGSRKGYSENTNNLTVEEKMTDGGFYYSVLNDLNKNCPKIINEDTQFDNVIALPDNIIQYNFTIYKYNIEELNIDEYKRNATEIYINQVKSHPLLQIFKEHNTTLQYNYRDKKGIFVCTIKITPEMYNKH